MAHKDPTKMSCRNRKHSFNLKSDFNLVLVFLIYFNNYCFTNAAISTTIPTISSTNNSQLQSINNSELTCTNVQDLMLKRGLLKQDITNLPQKGKSQ